MRDSLGFHARSPERSDIAAVRAASPSGGASRGGGLVSSISIEEEALEIAMEPLGTAADPDADRDREKRAVERCYFPIAYYALLTPCPLAPCYFPLAQCYTLKP